MNELTKTITKVTGKIIAGVAIICLTFVPWAYGVLSIGKIIYRALT